MTARPFLDTNVLVYFFTEAGARTLVAEQLVVQGGAVSIQVLNELASVALGKLRMSWKEAMAARDETLVFCPDPVPLTLELHSQAMEIGVRYGFHVYDALIVAAALEARSSILYTEDLQHGQIVESLRIVNPFL